jgi:hypothetical protein
MESFTAFFKKCANGSLVKLMHRLNIQCKLFVSPYERPTNKSDSARLHASRPLELSLKVRIQGCVFDLKSVDYFSIAHAIFACTRMHLLNATHGMAKNAELWQICSRA